ncbi:FAD:protein FMN transferase [Sphingomonas sp. BK235]|uniref:FAD:protein FMN transferase n=1 Tax=Sphingomonas sp. BK235 TaxID=2512131 RepID=UPI0010E77260|nr:FAD:protein FMN transferase [Sphingomonas sp. BK235]TCP37452.1 thiamine biosynthesis lipoprotein [Sphingomonas sp. BK235]
MIELAGATMGTMWRARIALAKGVEPDRLGAALVARLDTLVDALSHWSPTSAVSRFNRAPASSWHDVPPDLAALLAIAVPIWRASGGAFDPAIGALVDLWGFGPPGAKVPPDGAAVAAAAARSGWLRLAWDSASGRLHQPGGVALDLSAIGKGYAADALATVIAANGCRHFLVEVGGELVGSGLRPDGQPWWVELDAVPAIALPPLRVALHRGAVATSGSYVRGPHNLDPRSGRPVAHEVIAVSVIAETGAVADGWASALLVLGRDAGLDYATRERLAARFVTPAGEWLSPTLAGMIEE